MERISRPSRRPEYLQLEGLPYPAGFSPKNIKETHNYKPRDDDHIIATFPKCGTTWTQYIVTLIFRQGKPFSDAGDFFRFTPFMEMSGIKDIQSMPRPGAFKTHLPYDLAPKSTKAKYIYVARNPKDCCVSLYHHTTMFGGYKFQDGTFDDFFEEFMNGRVEYGDYFDHLMGWYEHRNDPNVYFITYESLRADPREGVKNIARFLGQKYFDTLENNPEILDNVLRYSSFEHMKSETNEFWTVFMNPGKIPLDSLPEGMRDLLSGAPHPDDNDDKIQKSTFIRKGIVGDWKNLMTDEQSRRMEQKFKEKSKGTDVVNLWKNMALFDDLNKNKRLSRPRSPYYMYADGLPYPGIFNIKNIRDVHNYKPKSDDCIIATFPKCGTTWMQYIVTLIFRQGKPFSGVGDFFRFTPFMEMCGIKDIQNMPRPGALKTHFPYSLVPKSTEAKYIYVARNPKDCCVSLYHHTKMFGGYKFQDGTFDEFFEEFINGRVEYGDYFDHLMGWYEHRNDPNVYFITYESLKADPRGGVKNIARFLGQKYIDTLENNPEILDNVLRYSSFEHMKNETNEFWTVFMNPDKISLDSLPEGMRSLFQSVPTSENKENEYKKVDENVQKSNFVRKGVIGDWRTLMTEEQSRRLETKFKNAANGSDVIGLWQNLGIFQDL